MGIIEFKDVSFQYPNGFSAVENVSFEINEGEAIAIIGQNGAGKTTTVKMVNGLLKPTHGTVLIDGMDTKDYTTAQLSKIAGYVFQNPDDQIFKYHVMDEVMFGPLNIGMSREEAEQKSLAALKTVGLQHLAKENPYDLELSERKLVAIASVLAMNTKVLILDEPTIAQDWEGRNVIRNIIQSLRKEGKTVLAILHDMDFVAESFERVIVMAHGEVLADGTREEVFAQKEVLEKARIEQPYLTRLCRMLGYERLYFSLKEGGQEEAI